MRICLLSLFWILLLSAAVWATPSTAFWTVCCPDIQAPNTTHLSLDNYFTVSKENNEDFPTDFGLTYGFSVSQKLWGEVGFDMLEPTSDPLFFNAKLGVAEGSLAKNSPALAAGLFNVGTRAGVTDQNIGYLVAAKTLPNKLGRLSVGGYCGNSKILKDGGGRTQDKGWMVAWDRAIKPGKFGVVADYSSGKNLIGGGGIGLNCIFNDNTSLLVGPVWFNDKAINGSMKWSTQVDINF